MTVILLLMLRTFQTYVIRDTLALEMNTVVPKKCREQKCQLFVKVK